MILFASASWGTTQTWNSFEDFAKGHFENVLLLSSGQLETGYPLKTLSRDLPSAVTATATGPTDEIYVGTSGPGQVWMIRPNQKPRLIFDTEQSTITQLISMPDEGLAILYGPQGGVTFIRPHTPHIARTVSIPEQPLSAYLHRDTLYVVGNSNALYTIKNYQLQRIPITSLETQFRAVHENVYGSGQSGTLYRDDKAIFKAAGETVAITEDTRGNLYAAFNTSSSSSQIWKISQKEPSCLVWESSKHLIFSLALFDSKLYWGVGPRGQLFSSQPECKAKPDILLSLKDHSRIMSIVPYGSRLIIATAQLGGIFELNLSKKATAGRFIAPVVKLEAPAKIRETSVPLWLGNTPIPDDSWSSFEKDKNRQAQFVEPRVIIMAGKPITEVSFSYNKPD